MKTQIYRYVKIVIFSIMIISLITQVASANCQGCCSHHGGVICIDGVTKCADGTSLSAVCSSKGCNKCVGVKPATTPTPIISSIVNQSQNPASPEEKTSKSHKKLEKEYQKAWCTENNGKTEVTLPDGTRADCVTQDNAIEVEFGAKWAEAIGQSLYYALQTGKQAGIVLILEHQNDYRFFIRLNSVIQYHKLNIKTWMIENY
jgi:hypothetical protein